MEDLFMYRRRTYRKTLAVGDEGRIVTVGTRNGENIWDLMRKFINSKKDGSIFSRKQLYSYIYERHFNYHGTPDTYRNQLNKIGVLETVSPGKYKKLRGIPKELTTSLLRELSNKNSWKSWFILLDHLPTKRKEKK